MLFVNRYLNIKLGNVLERLPKNNIFLFDNNGTKQLSALNRYSGNNQTILPIELFEFYSLIEYNFEHAKANKLNISDNYLLENKEYHFNKNNKPFFPNKGNSNIDISEFCKKHSYSQNVYTEGYTFVYYYAISPGIKGGELKFENGMKYKPSQYDVLCFDGNVKHKMSKLYGEGVRGTLIMNIDKKELI